MATTSERIRAEALKLILANKDRAKQSAPDSLLSYIDSVDSNTIDAAEAAAKAKEDEQKQLQTIESRIVRLKEWLYARDNVAFSGNRVKNEEYRSKLLFEERLARQAGAKSPFFDKTADELLAKCIYLNDCHNTYRAAKTRIEAGEDVDIGSLQFDPDPWSSGGTQVDFV